MIRAARPADDAAGIADIYRPHVTDSAVSFELEPPDAGEMARRITSCLQKTPWLVYEHERAVVGYAYATQYRERPAYQWCVEVSAYVRPDAQRRGVARQLYVTLLDVLARLGYYNAYAAIALPNDASIAFHASLGFEPIGTYRNVGFKHGRWHDVSWFARSLRVHDEPKVPPLPFAGVSAALGLNG